MIRKHTPLLFSALLLIAFAATLSAQNQQSGQDIKQRRAAVIEALRRPDGVHEAAKVNGGSLHRRVRTIYHSGIARREQRHGDYWHSTEQPRQGNRQRAKFSY